MPVSKMAMVSFEGDPGGFNNIKFRSAGDAALFQVAMLKGSGNKYVLTFGKSCIEKSACDESEIKIKEANSGKAQNLASFVNRQRQLSSGHYGVNFIQAVVDRVNKAGAFGAVNSRSPAVIADARGGKSRGLGSEGDIELKPATKTSSSASQAR
jgi:hypothetical protein